MAYSLALQTPARFTALAALSTWLPACLQARLPALAAQPFPHTLVHHGTRDQRIEVHAHGAPLTSSTQRISQLRIVSTTWIMKSPGRVWRSSRPG